MNSPRHGIVLLRRLSFFAALGLLAPIAWFLAQVLAASNVSYPLERVIRVAWPSSFWLLKGPHEPTCLFSSLSPRTSWLYTFLESAAIWLSQTLLRRKNG